MSKYKNIYVFAPHGFATGGVELCHQLVDYLRNNGQSAYIVYIRDNQIALDRVVTENYRGYNIEVATVIEDSAENILVLPEIFFDWMYRYDHIRLGFWWMSVDNRYYHCHWKEALKFFYQKRAYKSILSVLYHLRDRVFRNNFGDMITDEHRITHFYQSHYAQYHLYSKRISKVMPLSDYINTELVGCETVKKEDIILYNPAKGLSYTKRLIKKMPSYKFIPLKGLTRTELRELFQRAKLYIDFGNFPGKDRLPREAIINSCCIVTGKKGAAGFYEDIAIDERYKFDTDKEPITKIVDCLEYVVEHYDECVEDFRFMKCRIDKEQQKFYEEINAIFI